MSDKLKLGEGFEMLFLEWVTMTQGEFGFSEAESKVGVEDVMGLWASKCWVARILTLTMIEGEREGSLVVVAVKVGVTKRKDSGEHE